jgi:hypothetical protein
LLVTDPARQLVDPEHRVEHDRTVAHRRAHELAAILDQRPEQRRKSCAIEHNAITCAQHGATLPQAMRESRSGQPTCDLSAVDR